MQLEKVHVVQTAGLAGVGIHRDNLAHLLRFCFNVLKQGSAPKVVSFAHVNTNYKRLTSTCTKKISQFHRDKEDFEMTNNSVYFTDGNANGWVHTRFLILCVFDSVCLCVRSTSTMHHTTAACGDDVVLIFDPSSISKFTPANMLLLSLRNLRLLLEFHVYTNVTLGSVYIPPPPQSKQTASVPNQTATQSNQTPTVRSAVFTGFTLQQSISGGYASRRVYNNGKPK